MHVERRRQELCDAIPTGCTQCKNAGRQCPGYRSQVDLIFREETNNVIKKSKVKHEKAAKQRNSESVCPSSTAPYSITTSRTSNREISPRDIVSRIPQPRQVISVNYLNITPSIEDRATAFFLSNYVIGDHGPTRGHLDHISDLYESDSIDDNLVAAVQAVGLAGYSHSAKAPHLMNQARVQYARSLHLTNTALQSPTAVKKDSTLLAILILGIFETITGRNQKSMKAWAEHVHGAAAVIKLRGPEAIRSNGGIRLLAQVTSSLLISCIQRDIPLPKYIVEMSGFAQNNMKNIDPAWVAQRTMIDYTAFNARYHAGYYTDPHDLLTEAEALDERFLAFSTNVPKGWEYSTVHTEDDPDIVFDGYYHIYYDHWVAQIWNAIRELRILLNETVREVLLKDFASPTPYLLGPEYAERFQICTEIMYQLQAEILASVPQQVGYTARNVTPTQPWSGFKVDGFGEEFPVVRFSGGYFLIWPLFLVGNLRISTPEVRAFCVQKLRYIGTQMGIEHANLLASIMEQKTPITLIAGNHQSVQYMVKVKSDQDWQDDNNNSSNPNMDNNKLLMFAISRPPSVSEKLDY
ncbi:hypothetical protein SBOR_0832 [Sclerotinia borealis F-4128]|uniref:Zn(2)-C6 fungal-type domain-containing protein n=1 Tax=Sclerotinia borealis (strain F-4128) TaxID=1432307 RepID=W9CRR6_SCLBF|nr:hypothetical protein SBOR_0832 [Sclerotinia borealis F-4128]